MKKLFLLIPLISTNLMLAMMSCSSGAPTPSQQLTTASDLEEMRQKSSSFFSLLPKDVVTELGTFTDTPIAAQAIEQAKTIWDLIENSALVGTLTLDEASIGTKMREKFGNKINKTLQVGKAENFPIFLDTLSTS